MSKNLLGAFLFIIFTFAFSASAHPQNLADHASNLIDGIKRGERGVPISLLPSFAVNWSKSAAEVLYLDSTPNENEIAIFFSSTNAELSDKLNADENPQIISELLRDQENIETFLAISRKMRERPEFSGLNDLQMVYYWSASNIVINAPFTTRLVDDDFEEQFCIWIIFCR